VDDALQTDRRHTVSRLDQKVVGYSMAALTANRVCDFAVSLIVAQAPYSFCQASLNQRCKKRLFTFFLIFATFLRF